MASSCTQRFFVSLSFFFISPGRQFALLGAPLTTSRSLRHLESLDALGVPHSTVSAADGNGARRSVVSGSADVGRRTDGFGNSQTPSLRTHKWASYVGVVRTCNRKRERLKKIFLFIPNSRATYRLLQVGNSGTGSSQKAFRSFHFSGATAREEETTYRGRSSCEGLVPHF